MSASHEEKIPLLGEGSGSALRKHTSFQAGHEIRAPLAWHKRKSLGLAATLVLLAGLILTASKLRILFNPLHADTLASNTAEQDAPTTASTPSYWFSNIKLEGLEESLAEASPLNKLAQAQVATLTGGIPKLLHQFWDSAEIPSIWQAWPETWKQNNPDWEYLFWTPEDNDVLAGLMSPMLKSLYERMPQENDKAELARMFYLKQFGGCYAEIDFESMKPLDDLLQDETIVLAQVEVDDDDRTVPNAFMCSAAGHPFWDVCLAKVIEKLGEYGESDIAGPRMIHDVLSYWDDDEYKDQWGILAVLNPEYIFPITWADGEDGLSECDFEAPNFNSEQCKAAFPDAYAISYRPHKWDLKQFAMSY